VLKPKRSHLRSRNPPISPRSRECAEENREVLKKGGKEEGKKKIRRASRTRKPLSPSPAMTCIVCFCFMPLRIPEKKKKRAESPGPARTENFVRAQRSTSHTAPEEKGRGGKKKENL